MTSGTLPPPFDELRREEREVLADLQRALDVVDASAEDREVLARAIRDLDDLFLLVVVGEFNAGKSAFVNVLVGADVLAEGVTPTTSQVTLLRHGDAATTRLSPDGVLLVTTPVERLRDVAVVDTPGTNAIVREHQAVTERFVPRADLVLFLTSVDRPFTESERAFLELVRDWGKKIVVVLNKIDILERDEDIDEVVRFVGTSAERLLGITPPIFPVSVRLARRAGSKEPSEVDASRFVALRRFVEAMLADTSRLRLKLRSPLGVARRLADRQLEAIDDRLGLLIDDVRLLDDVGRQLSAYRDDMRRDFGYRVADVDNQLLEMERRGHAYFDETLRLGRVFDLLNRSRVQEGFVREVVADTPQVIERKVDALIDWLVDADFRQWQAVTDHLAEGRRRHRERIVGDDGGRFHHDRSRLIEAVGRDAQRVVDTYDRTREASAIADKARDAVAAAAALQVAAAGVGTAVTVAATTAAADITGLALAGVLAAIGLFVIPGRRARAKQEMRQKVSDLRERLSHALHRHFEEEIDASVGRVEAGIGPYARFVKTERNRLAAARETFGQVNARLADLLRRLEA
jgi:small GTP-binding protein